MRNIPGALVTVQLLPRNCITLTPVPAGKIEGLPLGIAIAAHSRFSWMNSLMLRLLIARQLLRRNWVLLAVKRGVQSVPGERGALHANRELRDAGKYGQLPKLGFISGRGSMSRHHFMEALEDFFRLRQRLALHALGHHGGGRLRNRAARALKADVADRIAIERDVHGEPIAAERIEPLGFVVRGRQLAEISRRLAVLQNYVLVQIAQVGHQANTSRTFPIPRTNASTSSRLL